MRSFGWIFHSSLKAGLLVVLLAAFPLRASASDELKLLFDSLQVALTQKPVYQNFKEQKIQAIKNNLKSNTLNTQQRYQTYVTLYQEYNKYNLDSAIHYSHLAMREAVEMKDPERIIERDLNHSVLFSMHGMFHNAEDILKKYSSKNVPEQLLHDYYYAHLQYEDYYSYTNYFQSLDRIKAYRDSMVAYSDKTTVEYLFQTTRDLGNEERQPYLIELLKRTEPDTPMYAMITFGLATTYRYSDINKCKAYLIRSALADLKNCIKESSSLYNLSLILYEEGDLENAYKFAQSAFDDALTAGIQFRVAQTSTYYSIINENYQTYQAQAQERLTKTLYVVIALAVVLALAVIYILVQLKRIYKIRQDLAESNDELQTLNSKLGEANTKLGVNNTQLMENNSVKEQYIGQFFNICSGYIDKIGSYQKELFKTASSRNLDEVIKKLKNSTLVDDEIEALYFHFDSTFLNLYPTFIQDINALLRPQEQLSVKGDNRLNKELRIYALLRLGITDSEKIANFLRCSISTIYNYRTKMRNKALDKDHFEEDVCRIGTLQN